MDRFRIVPLIKTLYRLTGSFVGAHRQQDIEVFQRLDAIVDERRLERILTYSIFTECLQSEERDLLYKFAVALQSVENQYLHPVVRLRARQLASELSRVLQIVSSTFSSDDGETFRFRPDPIDAAAYNREWDKLHEGVDASWKAYKTYRRVVKDRLKV